MPRKRPSKSPPKSPQVDEIDAPEEMISEQESPTLFDAEHPDDVVWIERLSEKDMKWAFQFKLLPTDCTMERIQSMRGGGRYRCTLKGPDPGGTGREVFKRRRTVIIDGPMTALNFNAPVGRGAASTTPAGTTVPVAESSGPRVSVDDILSAGILQLFQTQQQVNQTMMQAVKEARGNAPDLVPLLTALIESKQEAPPPAPAADPLELIERLGNVMKTIQSPGASFKDIVDTMNSVLGLRKKAHEEEESGDQLLDIVRENLPKVISVIQGEQARRGQPVTPAPELTRRLQQATTQTPAALPSEGQSMLLAFLQARRQHWLRYATAGRTPEVCALWEWENVPEQYRGTIREFMARDDIEQAFFVAVPEAQGYRQWYEAFLVALHQAIFPEQYEEEEVEEAEVVEPDAEIVEEGDEPEGGEAHGLG